MALFKQGSIQMGTNIIMIKQIILLHTNITIIPFCLLPKTRCFGDWNLLNLYIWAQLIVLVFASGDRDATEEVSPEDRNIFQSSKFYVVDKKCWLISRIVTY